MQADHRGGARISCADILISTLEGLSECAHLSNLDAGISYTLLANWEGLRRWPDFDGAFEAGPRLPRGAEVNELSTWAAIVGGGAAGCRERDQGAPET